MPRQEKKITFVCTRRPCVAEYTSRFKMPPFFLIPEIARIQSGGKPPGRDTKFVDIYHEKPIRLTVRALVPVKEHPKVMVHILVRVNTPVYSHFVSLTV